MKSVLLPRLAVATLCLLTTTTFAKSPSGKVMEETQLSTTPSNRDLNLKKPVLVDRMLPASAVEKLRSMNLWTRDFEARPENPINQTVAKFIEAIQSTTTSPRQAASSLFELGPCQEGGILLTECELYTAKIVIFRELSVRLDSGRKADLEQAFVEHYLNLSLNMISHSRFQPIQIIAQRMRAKLNTNEFRLIDLNDDVRGKLARTQYLDPSKATGIFFPHLRTMGVDLSKGISENAITIAHEIVHAADPVLEQLQARMLTIYPQVVARIGRALETPQAAGVLINSLLNDVYFEVRDDDYTSLVLNSLHAARERISTSEDFKFALEQDPDLARDAIIQEWTRLLIQITVENEFRAHLFSAAVYYQLAENSRLIRTDRSIVDFSDFLLGNPVAFAVNRGRFVDPFSKEFKISRIEKQIIEELQKEGHRSGYVTTSPTNRSEFVITAKFKNQINAVKSLLQLTYLNELLSETKQYETRYADEIRYIQSRQSQASADHARLSFLPEYVRQGYRADKVDAYTVLSARIGTAVILRFKEAVHLLNEDLNGFMGQLLLMKAQVLDLSGISYGELKLLGLQSATSTSSGAALFGAQANQDLGDEQAAYLKFFQLQTWKSSESLQQSSIDQDSLQSALYRLRLLKFLSWFEKKFPFGRNNLISARIIHDRLRDGQYDRSDIDEEKAKDLMAEAIKASELASQSGASIQSIEYLFNSLSSVYELGLLPQGADWNAVKQRFSERMAFEQNLLQENGINFEFNSQDFEKAFTTDLTKMKDHIAKQTKDLCKSQQDRTVQLISSLPGYSLAGRSVHNLTALCSNKHLYLIRRTDGRTHLAPSDFSTGQLRTQITFTSRYTTLKPFFEFGHWLKPWR